MNKLISVIVPTYNRCSLLCELLNSLLHQSLLSHQFEVIIVDDGSIDDTQKTVKEFQGKMFNLVYLEQTNKGPAAARNHGASQAQGKYIAFTDDDCIPESTWLENAVEAISQPNIDGIQGKTFTDQRKVRPLTHQIDNQKGHPAVPTCNLIVDRKLFLKVGGFDEEFPFPHNEDADFAWRFKEIGNIIFNDKVSVFHPPRKESFLKLSKRMKILESEFLLYHKSPELYKVNRNTSPWKTIYYEVFCINILRHFKSNFKYFFKPLVMISGMLLHLIWWYDLIKLYPKFKVADKFYQLKFKDV
ncbi:glycosyltransferase family 2 protein [Flexithrix dorotheae]|uniref:glycosyltransferase family 2 protein n=1 Tax=Flexithrix dorotheae TaxID=70993 RepID=UPI0003769DD6|nr:glycosyltransferase family A protein [Flexithrix dorotheae]